MDLDGRLSSFLQLNPRLTANSQVPSPAAFFPADPLGFEPQSQCWASIDWTRRYLDIWLCVLFSATAPLSRHCLPLFALRAQPSAVVWTKTTENRARLSQELYHDYRIC